jgi:glycosyltransferase involved in cell wall biosynthesis
MRIALVAPFGLRAKGTARARALPLGQALVRRGHEVTLLVPPYDSPEDSGRRWQDGGVEILNSPLPAGCARRGWAGALAQVRLTRRLLSAVRAWHPDLVHAFKPKGPSGLVAWALWQSPRRPALLIDSDDWEGAGGWNDDARASYSPAQRRFFAWQERYGLAHADAWTVTSDCLRARAITYGATPERVFVLPNALANAEVWRSSAPDAVMAQAEAPYRALLYTRFAGVRVAGVAAIWRRVVERLPQARLCVAGRGLSGEEEQLAGAAPNVDVLGWLEPAQMPAAFAAMNVAIVPWEDCPANRARHSAKVLELMAAGLPVVAYAVGELPVTLGESGTLAAPGDAGALAEAVVALLMDRERAARLGAAARARVAGVYTWEHSAEIALRAYAAALSRDPV